MRVGYGLFFSDGGAEKSGKCNVCGSKMDVERNYHGFTSWGGAMANVKRTCDKFTCSCIKEDWHEKAVEIIAEAERTESPSLKKMMLGDVKIIVRRGLKRKGGRTAKYT